MTNAFAPVPRYLFLLTLLFLCAAARSQQPDLTTIMQDPDWIGPPVEAAWWQFDGSGYHYRVKRDGADVRDVYRMAAGNGGPERLDARALVGSDGEDPVFNRERTRALSVRDNSLYLRDLDTGALHRLFTGPQGLRDATFATDGQHAHFRSGERWWRVGLGGSAAVPLTDLRFEDDPQGEPEDALEQDQLRLFTTLERQRGRTEELQQAAVDAAQAVPEAGPAPWYLGKGQQLEESMLSPDGRWLLVVVEAAGEEGGRQDSMPRFVDRSGYVVVEDVRRLVGRDMPRPQRLWVLDLKERSRREIDLSTLSELHSDPLADLKAAQDIETHDAENPRPLWVLGAKWHDREPQVLVQLRAIDNKDRWTVRLDADTASVTELHRLSDSAWINWAFNEFGWVPGSDRAWLLSEESGYSHLYTVDGNGALTQHTSGEFEVFDIRFDPSGASALMLSNAAHPTEYDLYQLTIDSGKLQRFTDLRAVESYAPHPDGRRVLLCYSGSYLPAQAAVLDRDSGALQAVTDTRTEAYRDRDWQAPQYVAVPSSKVDRPIWSKFYPARGEHEGPRPAVLFVHGAGYTQNSHHKFPYYFREQMFHNLLTARGYHVLDMDYRASRGYGRDWRTAIYRQMGTPELEDLIDGVDWLVNQHGADPQRIGVYGGSYGGFMTFMALFKAPEVFATGAALRPVTDWRHYNHFYTSNILNTPQVDPEAHRRSSPIEFAEGLVGPLLISHGMLDDNVFYKDSVRLAQRLIELGKEDWELASYPLEPHGYRYPESWLDQYRRILKLFEGHLGDAL